MVDWLADACRYAESWLDYQVRATEQPGCVLAVASGGDIVAERAFGLADLAANTPLTPAHRFRVASHSKTFTAAGIMALHEERRLHLDDPVGTHVLDLGPDVAAVTIGQLLSHSAGLPRDGIRAVHWQDRQPFLSEVALRAELGRPPTLAAATRFKYSNLGFGLLGLVIEEITGERYADWIARKIVSPGGLTATCPDMPLPGGVPVAVGYSARLPLGRRFAIPGHNPTNAMAAATGFVSTAGDLARFVGSLDPAASASTLSPASRREMTRPHWRVPADGSDRHYGLGTIAGTVGGHAWFGHSGAFQGFISRTACVPDWGVTVSVVTNAIDGPANPWVDGLLGIMEAFDRHGAADAEVGGWAGRWWSTWGALDLVPMGRKVLVAVPALLAPLADASVVEVSGPAEGRIASANGFASHGEAVTRLPAADGEPGRLLLGGSELLAEADLVCEIEGRAGDPAPARQP